MKKHLKDAIDKHLYDATGIALAEIEREARAIMTRHKNITEFVLGMGMWFFTTTDNRNIDYTNTEFKYLKSINDIFEEYGDILKLTGHSMRFTATGAVVTRW